MEFWHLLYQLRSNLHISYLIVALTDSSNAIIEKSVEPFDPIYNFNLQFGKQSIFWDDDDASYIVLVEKKKILFYSSQDAHKFT